MKPQKQPQAGFFGKAVNFFITQADNLHKKVDAHFYWTKKTGFDPDFQPYFKQNNMESKQEENTTTYSLHK